MQPSARWHWAAHGPCERCSATNTSPVFSGVFNPVRSFPAPQRLAVMTGVDGYCSNPQWPRQRAEHPKQRRDADCPCSTSPKLPRINRSPTLIAASPPAPTADNGPRAAALPAQSLQLLAVLYSTHPILGSMGQRGCDLKIFGSWRGKTVPDLNPTFTKPIPSSRVKPVSDVSPSVFLV